MAVQFDTLLMESPEFDTARAMDLLKSAGFIQGIHWDGGTPAGHNWFSIKLPTDGYVEIFLREGFGKAQFRSIIMRDRTGKEVPGMTSDFNVVREVLAYIANWENEKIEKYCFWNFEGQITQSNFAYLWYGATSAAERWVGLESTKFPPSQERINATKKYFKDKIKT